MEELLCQGAEGKVFLTQYLSRRAVVKERLSKSYRVAELDKKINKQRMQQEVRCMVKCRRAGVCTPVVYDVDLETRRITFECIEGLTLKQYLLSQNIDEGGNVGSHSDMVLEVVRAVGSVIGQMHDSNVVHGDLTTSNIMIRKTGCDNYQMGKKLSESSFLLPEEKFQVVLIDFGLGMTQPSVEDKAVDLYVLERAFLSTHPGSEELVLAALDAYRFGNKKAGATVLSRLEQVRQRGRKRDMCG